MKIIVGKINNVKIKNLKIARKLRVINEKEFKILDFENYKSLSHPWLIRLGNCLHMTSNAKSIRCLCKKIVKIVVALNKISLCGIKPFHFLFNPPIPHSI
jgi:hypothetical protein